MNIQQNRGMVLLVSLVMVALMSLIAVAAIRGSSLQEAMAGNLRDRNIAFQAAEEVLRAQEAIISNQDDIESFAAGNKDGYFIDLNQSTTISRPTEWSLTDWKTNGLQMANVAVVSSQPYVVTEELSYSGSQLNTGDGIDVISQERTSDYRFYRVTARASGLTDQAEVVLQSTFVR